MSRVNPGDVFGRLTAIEVVGKGKYYDKIWKCVCSCGKYKTVRQKCLTSGNTRSCGCLNDEARRRHRGASFNCVCTNCGKEFHIKNSRLNKSKLHFCSQSCRTIYLQSHPELNPRHKDRDDVEKFFASKLLRSRESAKKRGIYYSKDITPKYLADLWRAQHGKCFYSGVDMSFDKNDQLRLVSIDRVDSKRGYEPGNIVLCSYAFNSFKFSFPPEKIIEFISLIKRSAYIRVVVGENGTMPTYATKESAGADMYSSKDMIIRPGERVIIPTGIKMEIPRGCYGMLVGRSGNTIKRGLFVQIGIIDADYRGDIGVIAYNASNDDIIISAGERVGQIIIQQFREMIMEEVEELDSTDRGAGGYGSSGA